MKLFTYSKGQLSPGAEISQGTGTAVEKTCAININLPCDCDAESFINKLKDRDCADILLYGIATLTKGDSVSSVCPEDSAAVVCPDPLCLDNVQNSCLEITVDDTGISYLLYDGSELFDPAKGLYIRNVSGKLKLEKTSKLPEEEDENSDIVIEI